MSDYYFAVKAFINSSHFNFEGSAAYMHAFEESINTTQHIEYYLSTPHTIFIVNGIDRIRSSGFLQSISSALYYHLTVRPLSSIFKNNACI